MDILLYNQIKKNETAISNIIANISSYNKPLAPYVSFGGGVMSTDNFKVNTNDTHLATDWEIRKVSDNSLVFSSYNDTVNKVSINISSVIFTFGQQYKFLARHIGTTSGAGYWGELTVTVTFNIINPSIGNSIAGGYYAGKIIVASTTYALIVAPKAFGEHTSKQWKTSADATSNTQSKNDGWSNTNAMNNASHPAAQWCRSLSINGYTDWYLPAVNELELLYRNFKPTTDANNTTAYNYVYSSPNGVSGYNPDSSPAGASYTSGNPAQTTKSLFMSGGSEAFTATDYWSSSENPYVTVYAFSQYFGSGTQGNTAKDNSFYVRAVRRLAL